jgi:hypothetical protein
MSPRETAALDTDGAAAVQAERLIADPRSNRTPSNRTWIAGYHQRADGSLRRPAAARSEQARGRGAGRMAGLADSDGGRTQARTVDPLIKSQLLYQLSYAPIASAARLRAARAGV